MRTPRALRSRWSWLGFALIALIAASYALFFQRGQGGRGPRRVVLITMDTTRADHLGCYGYASARTPNLDRLAREGALFLDASAAAPSTLPSHASILTGLYPPSHGARNNGNHRLVPQVTTLAEVARAGGLATGAFIAAEVLGRQFGLDQGFDVYDDDLLAGALEVPGVYRHRRAEAVVRRALHWIEGVRSQGFFAWIHLFDPHAPYEQHPSFAMKQPYDSEIAYMDHWIGRVLAALEGWGVLDDTLIIAIADHGEGLGDHGELTHGLLLYQPTLRVPLLVRAPRFCGAGVRIEDPVSAVDILPTALDYLDLPLPPQVEGISLRGLFAGRGGASPRPLYFETLMPRYEYLWASLAGLRLGKKKYIAAPAPELYDLASDGGERSNLLAGAGPEVAARWSRRLADLVAGLHPPEAASTVAMDAQTEASMRALGYGFAPIEIDEKAALPDPKDRIQLSGHYNAIQDAWQRKDWPAVVRLCAAGVRERPIDLYQAAFAARAQLELKRYGEAEKLFSAILARVPAEASCKHGLALIYAETGREELALRTFEEAIALDPLEPLSHAGKGDVLQELGRKDEARGCFEKALALDPYNLKAIDSLGVLAAEGGKLEDAARWFSRALAIEPGDRLAHNNLLRVALDYQGRGAWGALLSLAQARLGSSPADPAWRYFRARAQQGLGDLSGAHAEYARLRAMKNLPPELRQMIRAALGR